MYSPTIKKKSKKKNTGQGFQLNQVQVIPRSKTVTLHANKQENKVKVRKPSGVMEQDGQNINSDMLKSTMLGQSVMYGFDDSILYKKTTASSLEGHGSNKRCRFCQFNGQNQVRYRPGQTTYFWCIGLTPVILCCVPFLVKDCQNQEKWCTSCKQMTDLYEPRCL